MILDTLAPALGMGPPARPLGGLKLAAVVADLTPFVVPERDLTDPVQAERGYRRGRLQQYDAILTPSLTTRGDVIALLRLLPERVFAIGNAADGLGFRPEVSLPMPLEARYVLHRLGIRRAFLLVDAGYPGRRPSSGCSTSTRRSPSVFARYTSSSSPAPCLTRRSNGSFASAEPRGGEPVLFTGSVSEAAWRSLMQHCAVLSTCCSTPASDEPILEAMLCGAVVVAGNNSAQAELLGDAGLLADPCRPRRDCRGESTAYSTTGPWPGR